MSIFLILCGFVCLAGGFSGVHFIATEKQTKDEFVLYACVSISLGFSGITSIFLGLTL